MERSGHFVCHIMLGNVRVCSAIKIVANIMLAIKIVINIVAILMQSANITFEITTK